MSQEQFEQMVLATMSGDNALRKQAEEAYQNSRKENPQWLMMALLTVAKASSDPASSQQALILLKKQLVTSDTTFTELPLDQQAQFKNDLLGVFGTTAENTVRRAATTCISLLGIKLAEGWPELWPLVFQTISQPGAPEIRAACCQILTQVATALALTFLKDHHQQLADGLRSCIMDTNPKVIDAAADTIQAFIMVIDDVTPFNPLIQPLLNALEKLLNANDHETATSVCGTLALMAESCPKLFDHSFKDMLPGMLHIASTPQLDRDLRQMAIEVILSYAETTRGAGKIKKVNGFIKSVFELLFQYLLNPEFEDDWATTHEDEKDQSSDETDYSCGSGSMDRLSCAIRGKALESIATPIIMEALRNKTSWQHRNAGLVALSHIAEGCRKQFEGHLPNIVPLITPFTADEHPAVRYAACQCFAQFSTDFSDTFRTTFANVVIPSACTLLADPVPRVQALAAGTLSNFVEELEGGEDDETTTIEELNQRIVAPYVDQMVNALVATLQSTQYFFVKNECLVTMSSVIEECGALMVPYVDPLVGLFQPILAAPESDSALEDLRKLKCRVLECITLLAACAGHKAFQQYAHPVCQYLVSVVGTGLPADDPRMRYILRGIVCMVKCVKQDFVQYLPVLMPILLTVSAQKADFSVLDNHEEHETEDSRDEVVAICVPGAGDKKIKMKTGVIEDKDLAMTTTLALIEELGAGMLPYLEDVSTLAQEHLTFKAYPPLRDTSAMLLQLILKALVQAQPQNAATFFNHIAPQMMAAMRKDVDVESVTEFLTQFQKMLEHVPVNTLHDQLLPDIANILKQIMEASIKRLMEQSDGETSDPEDENLQDKKEIEVDDEDSLVMECADTVGKLLKTCPSFVSYFEQIFLGYIVQLLDKSLGDFEHKHAICVLCEYFEHAPATVTVNTLVQSLDALLHYASDTNSEVLQAAMYSLCLATDVLGKAGAATTNATLCTQFIQTATQKLTEFLHSPQAKGEEYSLCTANACSCCIRIVEFFGEDGAKIAPEQALMNLIFTHLPLGGDEIEASRVHGKLTRLAASNHRLVKDVRPQLLNALSKVANTEFMDDDENAILLQLLGK